MIEEPIRSRKGRIRHRLDPLAVTPLLLAAAIASPACQPLATTGPSPSPDRELMYAQYRDVWPRIRTGFVAPSWLPDGDSFWYADGDADDRIFWRVDPRTNRKEPLFDVPRLRAALGAALGSEPPGRGVPFASFELIELENAARFRVGDRDLVLDLIEYSIRFDPDADALREGRVRLDPALLGHGFDGPIRELLSPDRRWFATVRDHDLWLRPVMDGPAIRLTHDGSADIQWSLVEAAWSPDGSRLVATRVDTRAVARIPVVEWLGVVETVRWAQPHRPTSGGPLRDHELHVFDTTGQRLLVQLGEENPHTYPAGWLPDGSELMVLRMSRDFKRLDLLAADPTTGLARTVLTDTQATFLWGNVFNYKEWRESGGLFTILKDGRQFTWMSERDGWAHLYLHDFDGQLVRRLTEGPWPVHRVVAVDEDAGWIYFTARGDPGRPYDTQVYRASLASPALERLADEPGWHEPVFSPSRRYFLNTHSSLDRPYAVDLRRADGRLLRTLSRADITALEELGWAPPEEFIAKAADGMTDLNGAIYKPHDFDPRRSYPVIEVIYAGPQDTVVPRAFWGSYAPLAQLGFVVVLMDGRGTPGRSKVFQDVVYGQLGRHEIPDHVVALNQIARDRPYMDMQRVGIYGRSWGGYFAVRAMLLAPEVYRVGVALAPGSEMYGHSSRVEPYLGLPGDNPEAYEFASNLLLADRLTGKLLLIHGTADVNAPLSQTIKLADALIRAGKPFDLLLLPEVDHFPEGDSHRYWYDAMRRYFQEHLRP